MNETALNCEKRSVQGKKVKHLRERNITPINLYGNGLETISLQCNTPELEKLLTRAKSSGLVTLQVADVKKAKPVVVREVQRDAVSQKLLHVNFFEVKMGEKLEVHVPIVTIGEAAILKMKGNNLIHVLNTLTVECLPGNIPNKLEVDISKLDTSNSMLRVKDIMVSPDYIILDDPEQVVLTISTHVQEQVVPKEAPVATTTPEEVTKTE